MDWLKRDLGSGLVVLLPILVLVAAVRWLYTRLAALPLVDGVQPPVAGVALSLLLIVTCVFSIGYLMRTALGTVLSMRLDSMMNRVPGLRVVYNASKMAVETAVMNSDGLERPVKLELWGDLRLTGFQTGQESDEGNPVVFVPTSPNVTSGVVVEVDQEDVIETDESVEDALTRVLSAGFGEKNGPRNASENLFSTSDDD
ncbi:Uncharacterized membrane protein [Natronoarchaeum philippinense]|uniref:Uncharacterized membrane protein n=1 Tax=Natronoarchaeum philippinense TaxID=558529 RepID=A0A285N536_NATPI|nr:DUF502 domain-containing protein [Natronoarchaeum philippinense]SNZ04584.1 Uncharacterized membrane protein [Natronoarchaeum philippinense]